MLFIYCAGFFLSIRKGFCPFFNQMRCRYGRYFYFAGVTGASWGTAGAAGSPAGGEEGFEGIRGNTCLDEGILLPERGRRSSTVLPFCAAKYERPRDVSMKTMATSVVIFPRKVVGPALPKIVWLDPPNAAPIEAPLPACRRTTTIKITQTTI
jgi:hypothetical protein